MQSIDSGTVRQSVTLLGFSTEPKLEREMLSNLNQHI